MENGDRGGGGSVDADPYKPIYDERGLRRAHVDQSKGGYIAIGPE